MVPRLAFVSRPLSVIFALLVPFLAAASAPQLQSRDAIVPRLTVDAGDALPLVALDVNIVVRGHLSRTTYTATFRNDDNFDVNGKFFLPLPDGASVTDLGLYFDGHLRHAVAVERERARVTYESFVHRRVDPLLAEWSTRPGFNYEIYPIPRHGVKQVFIAFDRELRLDGDTLVFDLDLRTNDPLERLQVKVDGDPSSVIRVARGESIVDARQLYSLEETCTPLDLTVSIAHPFRPREAVVEWAGNESYTSIPFTIANDSQPIAPAGDVVVFWDASGSTSPAKRAQLVNFLEAFVLRQPAFVAVTIIPFHVGIDEPIVNGRLPRLDAAKRLRTTLESMTYAGASDYQRLFESLPDITRQLGNDARVLVAGDGMATTGAREGMTRAIERLKRNPRPLTLVAAGNDVDGRLLRSVAEATGGIYLPLSELPLAGAVEDAMRLPSWFSITAGSNDDVAPGGKIAAHESMLLTANVRSDTGAPGVTLRFGSRRAIPLPYEVRTISDAPGLVRAAWARAKLASLLTEGAKDEALSQHGTAYTLLTPRTSLLVLDSWRDYQAFNIPMPPDVQAMYEAEIRPRRNSPAPPPPRVGTNSWFIRGRVSMDGLPLPGATVTGTTPSMSVQSVSNAEGMYWLVFPSRPTGTLTIRSELEGLSTTTRVVDPAISSGAQLDIAMRLQAIAEAITVTAASPALPEDAAGVQPGRSALWDREACNECTRLLRLATNDSDADDPAELGPDARGAWIESIVTYLTALPTPAERLDFYRRARSHVGGSKRFHIRVAEALEERDHALAVRILTDAVEQNGDDAPFIRLVARILEGWGETAAALHLFERSIDISSGTRPEQVDQR
ncbi:MAG: VIT domain-containing protein [Thermoanaerobaculia bacterium]